MNPTFMWVQAICLALACALLAFTPTHLEALVLATLLAVHWLIMNVLYTKARRFVTRSSGEDGGPDRVRQDRRVQRQAMLAVVAGLVAGAAGSRLGDVRLWHDRELLSVCAGALGALAWIVYASSLVDWYYVRPRLDGIVHEPPCRSSGDELWGNVTRIWYLHRGLAELLGLVAVIVAVGSFIGGMIAGGGTLPTAAMVALLTGTAGALLLLTQTAISTLRHRVLNKPTIWIGDELRANGWRAYVLHVTVRGIVVREWDPESATWGRESEITHDRLDEERLQRVRFSGCQTCSGLNPACESAVTGLVW